MKRLVLVLVLAAVVAAVPSALGRSPLEPPRTCEGLTICGPIGGPWVVVPGPSANAPLVQSDWMLSCPKMIVGGTDARVSDPWVDVTFAGRVGAPVNPGVTTGRTVTFTGVSIGPRGRPSSFIPFAGCIPSEGGPRAPTAAVAPRRLQTTDLRPGGAFIRKVRTLDLRGRRLAAGFGCKRGQRLVSLKTSIGIFTADRPTLRQMSGVAVFRSSARGRVFVSVQRQGLPRSIPVEVQVHVVCTGVG